MKNCNKCCSNVYILIIFFQHCNKFNRWIFIPSNSFYNGHPEFPTASTSSFAIPSDLCSSGMKFPLAITKDPNIELEPDVSEVNI